MDLIGLHSHGHACQIGGSANRSVTVGHVAESVVPETEGLEPGLGPDRPLQGVPQGSIESSVGVGEVMEEVRGLDDIQLGHTISQVARGEIAKEHLS